MAATPALVQPRTAFAEELSYQQHVQPILMRHCSGCHNAADQEGGFSLDSFDDLQRGTDDGPVLVSGDPDGSLMLRLITGEEEPRMPPEDEAPVPDEDIEILRRWIEQGMPHASTTEMVSLPNIPKLTPAPQKFHYVGSAETIGNLLIMGQLGQLEAFALDKFSSNLSNSVVWSTEGLAGKINSIRSNADQTRLIVSSGIAGLRGEIAIVDVADGRLIKKLIGHRDAVYCAAESPDGKWLASGSYDHSIYLWDLNTGEVVRELTGHNGAIYDLDFDPTSRVLATASGDQTVKLWKVASGERLDTLGQPEGEMLCVRFSLDGKNIFAAGADRQIRKWKLVSLESPAINPMLVARYAHESEILQLRHYDKDHLLSISSDQTVKLWDASSLNPMGALAELEEAPVSVGVHVLAEEGPRDALVVSLLGSVRRIAGREIEKLSPHSHASELANIEGSVAPKPVTDQVSPPPAQKPQDQSSLAEFKESEPNDSPRKATGIELPAIIAGKLDPADPTSSEDQDLYRFAAKEGQPWVIEVTSPDQSPVDSFIDILNASGEPVLRTRMQALRESYFTFRGKDSDTSDDFRLHKWEDMELDEYLYSGGEIVKLWLYPRGPDSGFKVYPGFGKRYTFFGTTPVTHALGEPAYVVRQLDPNEAPLPNGLPVFPIYFENDDDPLRRVGRDSRLNFTAPESGDYYLRVRDARGFSGPNFDYQISIRQPQPDFELSISGNSMSLPRGSGREWQVTAKRIDGLNAPIEIYIEGLPDGWLATNPLIVEAGQDKAFGTLYATSDAQLPVQQSSNELDSQKQEKTDSTSSDKSAKTPSESFSLNLVARSSIGDRTIEHRLEEKLNIALVEEKEVQVQLFPADDDSQELRELNIRPGETVSARVRVIRNGTESRIGFGKEDSGRNLPHGAYVDNIGLNGLLITEGNNEREFFITAAQKLQPGRRQFHLRSETKGNPTSRPIWLNVIDDRLVSD